MRNETTFDPSSSITNNDNQLNRRINQQQQSSSREQGGYQPFDLSTNHDVQIVDPKVSLI
ncbi:hypothetical protein BLA29_008120 [Euroglyphus maynei]|uniref:Uncharacterized protein n=1 Tax=Euroglyphus maynei TaxID=6958 RepID=A0A1Y3BGH2_EURMA|nr:hypothetical protein BLA29_008120 [Euroglyphus maynei]